MAGGALRDCVVAVAAEWPCAYKSTPGPTAASLHVADAFSARTARHLARCAATDPPDRSEAKGTGQAPEPDAGGAGPHVLLYVPELWRFRVQLGKRSHRRRLSALFRAPRKADCRARRADRPFEAFQVRAGPTRQRRETMISERRPNGSTNRDLRLVEDRIGRGERELLRAVARTAKRSRSERLSAAVKAGGRDGA